MSPLKSLSLILSIFILPLLILEVAKIADIKAFTNIMGSTAAEFKNPATATLFELVKERRSLYGLKAESPIPDDTIERIVQDAVLHVPSSFNTQTSRVVLLLKEEHKKVWDIAISAMEGLVASGKLSEEAFENSTKPKLNSFRAAYGTVSLSYT